jgi:imidazolonepropionase-like amidohydrolase
MQKYRRGFALFTMLAAAIVAHAQTPAALKPFLNEDAPLVVLDHVRVIDGTGAAANEDQRVVLDHGKIAWVGPSATAPAPPAGAKLLDLTGKTVYPGLVGMHEHLFYPQQGGQPDLERFYGEGIDSAPRLYLAGGVTSARTAGSVEPYTDISLQRQINAGEVPGPRLFITGPYLEGPPSLGPQMRELTGPDDAARMVNYWAAEGATSFKAYMHITPQELKAAIDAAHSHGIKVTGHLCSIGFHEAAALGIDNLEHGLAVDTEFDPAKKEGLCPPVSSSREAMVKMNVEGPEIQSMIADLIAHHVAITSTLAIFETFVPNRPPLSGEVRVRQSVAPQGWAEYATIRAGIAEQSDKSRNAGGPAQSVWPVLFKDELQFERDFVKQGGLLMAGCDPTGYGGVLPGFGDQRNLELLVEAGFSPVEAIHIATQNGAKWLGEEAHFGTIAAGKDADLVVVDGNPAAKIEDVEKVETVFKNGLGYDPRKLIESVRGLVGVR